MRTRNIIVLHLAALAAASLLFMAAPELDLRTSNLFYRAGDGFYLSTWPPVSFVFHLIPWLVVTQLLLIPLFVAFRCWRERGFAGPGLRAGVFVLLALALGPGVLVNGVFKDHWGRARPVQVSDFGGTRRFTPAPLVADQCDRNCSFVAGHPAVGFALIAYAYLARTRRRRRLIAAGAIAFGAVVGLVRIAQGGHFLSDVVFSGVLVSLSTAVLAAMLIRRDGLGWLWRRRCMVTSVIAARWIAIAAGTASLVLVAIRYLDRPVAAHLHDAGPGIVEVFKVVTDFGLAGGYLLVTALVVLALWLRARRTDQPPRAARLRRLAAVPAFLFLSVAASGLATDALKILFGRARPKLLFGDGIYGFTWWNYEPRYWSFPSGHTTTAFALATALFLLWPRFLPLYVAFAALIAVSRAVVGEHFVSDAVAGAFVGVTMTLCVRSLFARRGIDLAAIARRPSERSRPALAEKEIPADLVNNP